MNTTSKIDQDVKNLTAILGVTDSAIDVVRPDWIQFMRQGVIVNIHLSRWRAVTTLTPEHLGLTFADDTERAAFESTTRLGQVYLLPAKYIKALGSLDSKARKAVKKYAAQSHWGSFLTPQAYFEWKDENEKYRAEYYALRDEIFNSWQEVVFEVSDAQMANARAAYRREYERVQASGARSTTVERYTESQFVAMYVDAILDAIPGPEEVYQSFDYQVDLTYIPLPSLIAEEEANAQIEYDRVKAEREKNALEIRMRQEVLSNYRDRVDELVVDHMKRMVGELNDALYTAATDIVSTTQGRDSIHGRSVLQLKNAIDRVRALNVFDYADIEQMAAQAEQAISQPAEFRSVEEVTAKLQDIATVTRATLITIGDRPSRENRGDVESLGIMPPAAQIRQARQRLGLPEIEIAEPTSRQARKA